MVLFQSEVTIDAAADAIWPIIADVENWPEWASSFTSVQRLGAKPIGLGALVRIKQPKLAPGEWTISEWRPGISFSWVMRKFCITVTGDHILIDSGNYCEFQQKLRFEGWIGEIAGRLGRSLIERYMTQEAEGLKNVCEKRNLG